MTTTCSILQKVNFCPFAPLALAPGTSLRWLARQLIIAAPLCHWYHVHIARIKTIFNQFLIILWLYLFKVGGTQLRLRATNCNTTSTTTIIKLTAMSASASSIKIFASAIISISAINTLIVNISSAEANQLSSRI